MSLRPPPKISLKHYLNWTRGNEELGSTICDRSEKPEDTERGFVAKGKTSRSHEIDAKRLH